MPPDDEYEECWNDDMEADGNDCAEEEHRAKLAAMRDEDGNPIYEDEDYDSPVVEMWEIESEDE